IKRARKTRKMLGGGMRQAGLLAAAGLYALENHLALLKEDHVRAANLAKGLGEIEGAFLETERPPSNMVYLNLDDRVAGDSARIATELKERDILVGITGERQFRMVIHLWISDDDVQEVIQVFKDILH
ncbi:MAG: threonine aldolase, partial [Chloroflexi bacterium]|nr:threonine aldolase [Chloroflexota bacterium]